MIIFIDMDGVIANFNEKVATIYGTTCEQLEKKWEPGEFSIHHPLGLQTEDEMWARIHDFPHFFSVLEEYPWTQELLTLCWNVATASGDRPLILSAPSRYPESASAKVKWMNKHIKWPRNPTFPNEHHHDLFRDYVLTSKKALAAGPDRLLIDDSNHNCRAFRKAGGQTILFPQLWNANHKYRHDPMSYVKDMLATLY